MTYATIFPGLPPTSWDGDMTAGILENILTMRNTGGQSSELGGAWVLLKDLGTPDFCVRKKTPSVL